jgi:hypothetical protein
MERMGYTNSSFKFSLARKVITILTIGKKKFKFSCQNICKKTPQFRQSKIKGYKLFYGF